VFRQLTVQRRHALFRPVTWHDPNKEHCIMAIEVRIPTILRSYTGEQKAVNAEGDTLGAVIDDLEAHHPGIKGRLLEDGPGDGLGLRRFVNVYVNDEDVRFIGGLDAEITDGDQVVVLPAVAGG
jgi:molybdopterin converting factor small subunit